MKIFYDTELLEDGKTIELISIGMVRDDGQEYYAVNLDMNWNRVLIHGWLRANVVPHLPVLQGYRLDLEHTDVKPRRQIRNEVSAFLHVENPELWAWYGAYDHVALCQLWGSMVELPEHVPMWTNDIMQEAHRYKIDWDEFSVQSENEHNALADARFNVVRYNHIRDHVRDLVRTSKIWENLRRGVK
jgi:hypothetical protein